MNLKKKYRLSGKEIRYIVKSRRWKYLKANYFSFSILPQYQNCKFNKFSVQINVKIAKKTVYRSYIKRVIIDEIFKNDFVNKPIRNTYWKVFVITNKQTVPQLKKIVENNNIKELKQNIRNIMKKNFNVLFGNK